ncbi:MAG: flavodoxin [Bacteroidota bacterium]
MANIGLFYGSSTGNTELIAQRVKELLYPLIVELFDVAECIPENILNYNRLILGISTWGNGDLQDDWTNFLGKIRDYDFSEKKIAIFGLGDQDAYAETFVDAMGVLFNFMKERKAKIIGRWPLDGYNFISSKAVIGGFFVGLPLDEDSQGDLTLERLKRWTDIVKKDFFN